MIISDDHSGHRIQYVYSLKFILFLFIYCYYYFCCACSFAKTNHLEWSLSLASVFFKHFRRRNINDRFSSSSFSMQRRKSRRISTDFCDSKTLSFQLLPFYNYSSWMWQQIAQKSKLRWTRGDDTVNLAKWFLFKLSVLPLILYRIRCRYICSFSRSV